MSTPAIYKYNNTIALYIDQQFVESFCNEILFINTGTANVLINSIFTLQPMQSISFDGRAFEQDVTRYYLSFSGDGTPACTVIRKFYNF